MMKAKFRSAFTIVELIVVISVIGILAGIVILSFGAWRTEIATSSLKNDLIHAASTMESARTFSGIYPISGIPSTFTASANNTLVLYSPSTTAFCIDGTSSTSSSIQYYIDNFTQTNGATSGTCATRTTLSAPNVMSNVSFVTTSTQITVSWTPPTPDTSLQYEVQCALDQAFITGVIDNTINGNGTTQDVLIGANPTTTYYCRVRGINNNGQSAWTNSGGGNTQQRTCSDTNQYGTYPVCFNYDPYPVGTSVAGYWTTIPSGYLAEDGSAVSRTTYSDLFAVIGTTYGAGDGSTTFNLPDSRGRAEVNLSSSDAEFNTVGEKYGSKTDVQTVAELPTFTYLQNPQTYILPVYASGAEAGGYGLGASGKFQNRVYVTGGASYTALSTTVSTNQTTGGSVGHNIIQPSFTKRFAIKFTYSAAQTSVLPSGTSIHGYWSTVPSGYLAEDGSAVSRTTYSDLFAAIGTTYGAGDGSTTFNLPDSRGRVAVNLSPSDAEFNTMGEKYGQKTHTMTVSEMPSHTYIQNPNAHTIYMYTSGSEAGGYGVVGNPGFQNRVLVTGSMNTSTDTATNQPIGSNTPENIIQPSIVTQSAIKYTPAGTSTFSIVPIGTSTEGYWSSAPTGYLVEDGSAVSRSTYSNLFAAIGTTYGAGDGSTTFNLPDSRGRVAVNINPSDVEFTTLGETYGEKTHLMIIAEMATNAPTQNPDTPTAGLYVSSAEAGGYGANSGGGFVNRIMVTGGGTSTNAVTATNQSGGGGQAFNVIQPSIVKLIAIKY